MKKSMKGTIAIAAGIALLLGGGGSMAYWQGTASTSSAVVQTGELGITVGSNPTWQVKRGTTTTPIANISTFKMVPGDQVIYTVPFQTVAAGTNLTASGSIAWGGFSSVPAHLTAATTGSTYNSVAISGTTFTVAQGTANGSLVFTLTWPFGANATNDTAAATMNQNWNLGATTVTVTQTANGATP
ncbi:alternate-type signal peptide domain-containing protein [Microbacterium sp. SSM24]|uniref:alternate-type signal peptide domain-containing protein n=1 Tax=Microbacterium sp. SSM24 TaxID=2991714 RepID=UPI00222795C7|nr:alternate-type signal peptide domain-containing protein [Microbacterium sp. SSM24]MCW3493466.1 alternate-type signal peptide domain-containing protein [Microbacterium sp. SSM24]